MSQYKTGTVTVTNGNNIVTGDGTSWLANVSAGDWFKIDDRASIYQIASVDSDTQIHLTINYAEASGSGLAYCIVTDFTPTLNLPLIFQGDIDWPDVYNRGIMKIDDSFIPFDLDPATPMNDVWRIRMSDWNFISNSSFESWLAGTNVAPDNWTLQGTASIERDSTAYQGSYSAKLTFGAATDGEFFAIWGVNLNVDYTFSVYVSRISGTGNARMVAQQNFGGYVEDKSVALPTGAGPQLITLTFQPSASGDYRINFKATDANGSVWRIDEVKVQESKGVATTWTPNFIDDTFYQWIYARKFFKGGLSATLPVYANNEAALGGGLVAGDFYRTNANPDFVAVVH